MQVQQSVSHSIAHSLLAYVRPPKLLADAATLAPFMTLKDFGTVSKISAILLFGFLVPSSTGNDFFVAQHTKRQTTGSQSSERSTTIDIMDLSLEERLENCSRFYSQGEFGEVKCLVDPTRERAFVSFLVKGVGPLLASRPAHPTETDLLHLCAMTISPQPQEAFISQTVKVLSEKESSSWTRTKRLMESIHPRSFHVNYSHRLMFVEMMANQLVLPEKAYNGSNAAFADDVLHDGAVPHLRAALHSFAVGASVGATAAHRALVNIAVRTGEETAVNEEWDAFVKLATNDCTECECNDVNKGEKTSKKEQSDCVHVARGLLMERFILIYNESRHYADAVFTQRTLDSLSSCLESSMAAQPCVVASLLMAARSLFYFLLADDATNGEDRSGDEARDAIIRTAIALLHYPTIRVAKAASSLLALAFSYNPKDLTVVYVQGVEKSIQMALDGFFSKTGSATGDVAERHFQSFHNVVVTLSRLSSGFAADMLDYLSAKLQQQGEQANPDSCFAAFCMISTVTTARPFAAQKHCDSILSLSRLAKTVACKSQLVATLLTLRQTYFFARGGREDLQLAQAQMISDISDDWIKYKLACQALVTGNDRVAKNVFESILCSTSSESSFLWISVLSNVAVAEDEVASKGCHGILSATPPFYTAVSYLESLAGITGHSYGFQIEYLGLRIDFLEQCACLHNLCREIRLSGTVPKATVRTGLHLRTSLKLCYSLAGRCYSLYKRYGLFLCQQSRTALRTCHAVCRWLGDAGRKTFPEVSFSGTENDDNAVWPRGDQLHPSILLLKKLNKVILDPMDSSFDPQLRGAAMAEILEAILMTPFPFPRGFSTVKSIPSTSLRFSTDGSDSGEATNGMQDDGELIDTCTIIASGQIPSSIFQKAELPFSHVLVWHSDRFVGPLDVDDEALSEGGTGMDSSVSASNRLQGGAFPIVSSLLPDGRFMIPIEYEAPAEEGLYAVEVTLGCRDVRCGEWELPVAKNCRTMLVRVQHAKNCMT